jgi:hypothetical protein
MLFEGELLPTFDPADGYNEPMLVSRRSRGAFPLLGVLTLPLWILSAPSTSAHPDSPSSPPLIPLRIRLKHQKPAAIVALFARERLPVPPGEHLPRAARSDSAESLLPGGIDALFPAPDGAHLVVVGTEAHPAELRECIQMLDAPAEAAGPDRQRIVLTLRHADPGRARRAVLRLSATGSATVSGKQLALEGTRAWLHRALRQVIRVELKEPEELGLLSR